MNPVMAQLAQHYRIEDPETIGALIDAHPAVVPVLLDAPAHIRDEFGDVPLLLEAFPDFENEGALQLVLVYLPTCDPAEAGERDARLRDNWWYPATAQTQGALTLLPDYR